MPDEVVGADHIARRAYAEHGEVVRELDDHHRVPGLGERAKDARVRPRVDLRSGVEDEPCRAGCRRLEAYLPGGVHDGDVGIGAHRIDGHLIGAERAQVHERDDRHSGADHEHGAHAPHPEGLLWRGGRVPPPPECEATREQEHRQQGQPVGGM